MKFRRKDRPDVDPAADAAADAADDPGEAVVAGGPWDVDDVPDDDVDRIDLGSLLLEAEENRELRLQVEEATGDVASVLIAGEDGAVELRAFAAPRNGDLWSEVRPAIAAEMTQRGGLVDEREGRFGTELVCRLQVQLPDGKAATQPSRIIGVNGPRWMLRATLLGRPAVEVDDAGAWEETITKVVVRRGSGAMPVGDPLPVVLPDDAERLQSPPS